MSKIFPYCTIKLNILCTLLTVFILCTANIPLWQYFFTTFPPHSFVNITIFLSFAVVLSVITYTLFYLFAFQWLFKPLVAFILILTAVMNYFTQHYGIIMDLEMMRNVFATTRHESSDLLTWAFVLQVFVLGVVPALLLCGVKITYPSVFKLIRYKLVTVAMGLVLVTIAVVSNYENVSIVIRQHGALKHYVTPWYGLNALLQLGISRIHSHPKNLIPIAMDAKRELTSATTATPSKKTLIILVVGETARAENFSLNGYARQDNPKLAKENIIDFPNTYSCGTSTLQSVNCMFSHLGFDNFSLEKAQQYENILDVLQRLGITIFWRDNNTGCQGVCNRVPNERWYNAPQKPYCNSAGCTDEYLLANLQQKLPTIPNDTLIVLHQAGSHGPAYYKRVPKQFERFMPECTNKAVQDCSAQTIINAYDNTIVTTDAFLDNVIQFLRAHQDQYATAMIYMSDHGESLGEHGIYLHGLPYWVAPDEQKHIPFILWMSNDLAAQQHVNVACLSERRALRYSHDNLFSTLLGVFKVKTALYKSNLDVMQGCRKSMS